MAKDALKRPGGKKGRKRGRNYRLRHQEGKNRATGDVTRYRADHGIPKGSRKDIHARGDCPVHNKVTRPNG